MLYAHKSVNTIRNKLVNSGRAFEQTVSSYLHASLDCFILTNRCFMSNDLGRPIETDVVVVTSTKVYCVECKNYRKSVSGDKFDEYWNFISSKRGKTQNPYLLNKKRIRMMRASFYREGLTPPEVVNCIVVPNSCRSYCKDSPVYSLDELCRFIVEDSSASDNILDKKYIYKFLMRSSVLRAE